jgi:hypothetical protein
MESILRSFVESDRHFVIVGVEIADAVEEAIELGLCVKITRPALTEGAISYFGKGSNGTRTQGTRASEVKEVQISQKLASCHPFVFDFDNPTIAKIFHQTAGKTKPSVVNTPIAVFGGFASQGKLLMVKAIKGTIVAKGEGLGVVTGGVENS